MEYVKSQNIMYIFFAFVYLMVFLIYYLFRATEISRTASLRPYHADNAGSRLHWSGLHLELNQRSENSDDFRKIKIIFELWV